MSMRWLLNFDSATPPAYTPANLVCRHHPAAMNSLPTLVKCSKSKKPSRAWDGLLRLG